MEGRKDQINIFFVINFFFKLCQYNTLWNEENNFKCSCIRIITNDLNDSLPSNSEKKTYYKSNNYIYFYDEQMQINVVNYDKKICLVSRIIKQAIKFLDLFLIEDYIQIYLKNEQDIQSQVKEIKYEYVKILFNYLIRIEKNLLMVANQSLKKIVFDKKQIRDIVSEQQLVNLLRPLLSCL